MSSDSLIQPILDFIKCGFPPLQRHFSYAFKCDSKLQGLQEQVQQLQNKKERLQQSIVEATSNGEEIFSKVTEWLSAAEKDVREADTIIHRKEDVKNKCLFGLCPNFKTRYQLSKIAEKKSLAIVKLCNQQGFDSVSLETPQQQMVEPSVYIRKALPSRVSMLNQVIDALRDPNLDTIGVYGIGGVGKTTLAKEVQAKSLQEKMFEKVAVVDVSQTPLEVRRIQGEIADFLDLRFDSEEISGRASLLHKRLKKSRVLIILDNLSEIPDLVAVGISSKVCKIMLTSRNMYLLSRKMGVQKLFSLEALQEVEALSLFMSVAEPNHDFLAIATNIAKKCAGLPLLIKIVAGGLKNEKSQHVWNDTLDQLATYGREDMYERVFIGIDASYEKLPGEEIKSLFLLCALFGQSNIHIQYLLTYSMGLGLFKHIENIEGARDRVFTLIDGLKANGLLLDGDMVGFVKMHDVVRDIAISRLENKMLFSVLASLA